MNPGSLFTIITNSTLLATRLLSSPSDEMLTFSRTQYCVDIPESSPLASTVIHASAIHHPAHQDTVRYSIPEGNQDGVFTIHRHSGLVSLAAPLDYENKKTHELVVAAECAGVAARATVVVRVRDANDHAPVFPRPAPRLTLVEEDDRDLPTPLLQLEAVDKDECDRGRLLYNVAGDGVDGLPPRDAFLQRGPPQRHPTAAQGAGQRPA
ncbi:putative neural-cadherin 2 [Scylla paramamosain]|uniref:putative neural-cadherin 2 n=1 Tax=Scylla paramamosain TaxID=85552 RepID=UPI0030831CE1